MSIAVAVLITTNLSFVSKKCERHLKNEWHFRTANWKIVHRRSCLN